jgi:biotin carboxylase
VHEDALKRIEALEWWGVGMLEYRWDAATGTFALMEFNARFWGSLHLALFAGVDFPRLLADAWAGRAIESVRAPVGVRCRYTFPKEAEYLWSLLRDSNVHASTKLSAVLEFITLSVSPGVHSDLWFPRDRSLYFRALAATPGKFLRRS